MSVKIIILFSIFLGFAAQAVDKQDAQGVDCKLYIRPFSHMQVYETGASGYTWYRWTLDTSRSDNSVEAFEWLFKDQNLEYIRNAFDQFSVSGDGNQCISHYDIGAADRITVAATGKAYPETEYQIEEYKFEAPNSRNIWVYNQAKKLNPRMKLMAYGHMIPACFRTDNGNKKWHGWPLNRSLPRLDDYLAKWMFANLINLKLNEKADVDILDIFNEADVVNFGGTPGDSWNANIVRQRDEVAYLLHNVVPKLREWVMDTGPGGRNQWGVKMPLIMAPSCVDTTNSANWLKYWHDNRNNDKYPYKGAWDNIDIVSIHQYGGGYKASPYRTINKIRGGRPFMQSEMHMGDEVLTRCPLPDKSLEDDLQASLLLGHFFSDAVNNGVSVYDYYMGISKLNKPESLVLFQKREFSKRKIYHAYRQLTNSQPAGSSVVDVKLSDFPDGFDVVAYHRWDDKFTFTTITNRTAESRNIKIILHDHNSSPMQISRVVTHETSATLSNEVVSKFEYPSLQSELKVTLPAHSIQTFAIEFGTGTRRIAFDSCKSSEFKSGEGWLLPAWTREGTILPAKVVFNKTSTFKLAGNPGGFASVRNKFTEPQFPMPTGMILFKWDLDNLGENDSVLMEAYRPAENSWHRIWTKNAADNGSDSNLEADDLQQAAISLDALGGVSELRFRINSSSGNAAFYITDIEAVRTQQ